MSASSYPQGTVVANVTEPLQVTADNVSGNGAGFSACGAVSSSGSTNTLATGGTPPYTFAWVQTGPAATAGPFNINSPTSQFPGWNDTRCDNHLDNNENWTVTVTDDNGQEASDTISVELFWVNLN